MKKITIITTLVLSTLSVSSIAQKQISIDLSSYKLSDNAISYSNSSSDSKETIITFLDSIKLDVVILNEKLKKTTDTISYELPSSGYSIQKAIINEKHINYLITKKDGYMSILNFDRASKKWNLGSSLAKDGERLLASISYENDFYIFNYNRKAEIIKSYTAGINGLTPFKDYNVSDFKMGENNLSYFLKKKKKAFKSVTNESPNELYASRKAKKVFQFNENVYFSIDDSITHNTGLIHFNLKTKEQTVSYFKNPTTGCDSILFNKSTLSQNYLATISGCLKNATINIWSLKTGKIIKSTSLVEKELITIKNYDNLISTNRAHSIEILKSQVLLRQFAAGSASIYLYEQPNNLELLVGKISIKKKKNKLKPNGRGGKGDGTGGGRQKKIDRLEKRKIKGSGLSKSFLNFEASKTQYFVANLNLKEKQFDTKSSYQNTFGQMKEFKNKNNLNGKKNLLFIKNNQFWFGNINYDTQKLELLKFE